jgi:hypothetical protein
MMTLAPSAAQLPEVPPVPVLPPLPLLPPAPVAILSTSGEHAGTARERQQEHEGGATKGPDGWREVMVPDESGSTKRFSY